MNYSFAVGFVITIIIVTICQLENILIINKTDDFVGEDQTYLTEPEYDSPLREVIDQQGSTPTILRLGSKIDNGPINYCSYRCNVMQMENAPEFIVQNADAVVLDKNRINSKIAGLKETSLNKLKKIEI